MTIKELIEILNKYDQSLEILIGSEDIQPLTSEFIEEVEFYHKKIDNYKDFYAIIDKYFYGYDPLKDVKKRGLHIR